MRVMGNEGVRSETIQISRFSTETLSASDRFDVWRSSISVLFEIEPGAGRPGDFKAGIAASHLGSLLFAETAATGHQFSRSLRKTIADGIDHYVLQLYCEGGARARFGDLEQTVRPGDLFLFDLAKQSVFDCDDFRNLSLIVPRALLESRVPGIESLHGCRLPAALPLVRLLKQNLLAMREIVGDCPASHAGPVAEMLHELTARCLSTLDREIYGGGPTSKAALMTAIRRFVEIRLADPNLDWTAVCAEFRLSRSYLYELFVPLGGVAHYIQQRRLMRSLSDLQAASGHRRKIAQVAFTYGFTSESHFSRTFRKAFGMTPSEARVLPPGTTAPSPSARHAEYEEWVRVMASAAGAY